jgi:hypothetical protein
LAITKRRYIYIFKFSTDVVIVGTYGKQKVKYVEKAFLAGIKERRSRDYADTYQ